MGDPILLVQHYFFKNFPLPLSKTDLTDKPKNKWGPMDENILFFQKCLLIFVKPEPINYICCDDS